MRRTIGLDPASFHVSSAEAIAEGLRRAAYYFCPCASATLVRAVVEPMKGLVGEIDDYREIVRDTLDAMIGHGDLLEHGDVEDSSIRSNANLVYGSPLRFVMRDSGAVIFLGISSPQSFSSSTNWLDFVQSGSVSEGVIILPYTRAGSFISSGPARRAKKLPAVPRCAVGPGQWRRRKWGWFWRTMPLSVAICRPVVQSRHPPPGSPR